MVTRAATGSDLAPSIQGQVQAAIQEIGGKPAGKPGVLKGKAAEDARKAAKQGVKEAVERKSAAIREAKPKPEARERGPEEPKTPTKRGAKKTAEAERPARKSRTDVELETEQAERGDAFAKAAEDAITRRERNRREEPEEEEPDEDEDVEAEDSKENPDEEDAADADDFVEEAEDDEDEDALSHEDALSELRAHGFGKDARRRLSKQDAVQMATALRAASASRTSETARAVQPEGSSGEPAPPQGQPGGQSAALPAAAAPVFDPKKATERLRRAYGDDDADGFGEGLKAANDDARQYADHRFDAAQKHLETREKDLVEKSLRPIAAAVGKIQLTLARQELERVYPELEGDDKQWARVVRKAAQHKGRDTYTDLGELLSDSAASIFAPRARKREEREAAHRARDRSSISTSARAVGGRKIKSKGDAFAAVANAIIGGDEDEADRIANEHF